MLLGCCEVIFFVFLLPFCTFVDLQSDERRDRRARRGQSWSPHHWNQQSERSGYTSWEDCPDSLQRHGRGQGYFFFHAFKEQNFKKPHPYDCAMMWGKFFFFYVIEKLGNQLHKITFCFSYVGPRSTWKQCLQPCIACWPPRNNQFTSEHQLHIFLQSDSCQTLHYCHLFALIWTTGTPTSEPAECLHLLFYIKGGSKKELVKMNFFC